jgi:hypothetical protein
MGTKKSEDKTPTFFKRARPSQVDLAGFWNRGQGDTFTGVLVKYVPNDKAGLLKARPFFIFRVTSGKPEINIQGQDEPVIAELQDYIGVAANWSLTSVIDKVEDIGRTLRLTVTGKAPNPNGGKEMTLIDVEVAE